MSRTEIRSEASRPLRRRQRGVTLIELAIVMAVVGIIMAIAIPSYQNQTIKTRRSVAQGCLLQHAQLMERFYTDNLSYDAAPTAVACTNDAGINPYYTFAVTSDATTYTLTAARRTGSPQMADTLCNDMTLNNTGARTPTTAGCWQ